MWHLPTLRMAPGGHPLADLPASEPRETPGLGTNLVGSAPRTVESASPHREHSITPFVCGNDDRDSVLGHRGCPAMGGVARPRMGPGGTTDFLGAETHPDSSEAARGWKLLP
jgi:hypothetical protein